MSEQTTDQKDWTRPTLQRRELGPMLHEYTHNTYDVLEALALDRLSDITVPTTMRELTSYSEELQLLLDEVLTTQEESMAQSELIAFLELQAEDTSNPNWLTIVSPVVAVREGLASGIHVPFYLYQMVDGCKRWHSEHPLVYGGLEMTKNHQVEPAEFAERIVSPVFLKMLGQLGYAVNGYLGPNSTAANHMNQGRTLGPFSAILHDPEWSLFFETDEAGVVTGFSQAFLQKKQQVINTINQNPERSKVHTGGCPVRHDTFKVLGEHAARYIAGDRPLNEGTSAITRGAQLVSNVMKAKLATL